MACPLCRRRKGKRRCPAKGEAICAQCCGSKRLVEIDCPEDCVYLGAHAGSWAGRVTEQERDMRRLAPYVQGLDDDAARLFFLALTGVGALARKDASLDDARLSDAVATLLKTSETRASGLVYEHRSDDPRVQAVVDEIDALLSASPATVDGAVQTEAPPARPESAAAAVKALSTALSGTRRENAGGRAFVETAERLAARFGAPVERETTPASPLIVKP